jgi:DNA ligase-associated metallophosphoesterase
VHPAHLNFQGESLLLDPAGALIWPRHALLAVADLHLEKGSACAGRGQLVPPWDSALTLARLAALMRRYAPRILVALGDSFHDRFAASRLSGADRAMLNAITGAARMVWVLGNHDPVCLPEVAGEYAEGFELEGLVFRHEARGQETGEARGRATGEARGRATGEVSGHFHPKARVVTRAAEIMRPCFMCGADKIILPSFGAYTGGLDVRSPAIAAHFPAGGRAYLLGKERLFTFEVPARAAEGAPGMALARAGNPHKSVS